MRFFLCLFCFVLSLAACGGTAPTGKLVKQYGGPKTQPDRLATRTIILLHSTTGERLNLTYYHDGSHDRAAMRKINKLFRDRRDGTVGEIDPELVDFLVDIRTRLALPPTVVFEILSGYRSRDSNSKLARSNGQVATESLHMYGLAVDFRIAGVHGSAIAEVAKTMQRGGVSFYPSSNHVHVDIGNIRTWATR